MSDYTPGPWVINRRMLTSINALESKKHIAMVNYFHSGKAEFDVAGKEHEANVNLICAAPDMFESIEAVLVTWDAPERYTSKEVENRINVMRAAYNKAKGGKYGAIENE